MTYTYDSTDLTTTLAQLRTVIGDVEENDWSLSDEEIQYRLDENSNVAVAAVRCQEDRVARAAMRMTIAASGKNSARNEVLQGLKDHLKILKRRVGLGRMHAYAGQVSQARLDTSKSDTDYPAPAFTVGKDDFQGTSPTKDDDE